MKGCASCGEYFNILHPSWDRLVCAHCYLRGE